jgi:hypothetical protein
MSNLMASTGIAELEKSYSVQVGIPAVDEHEVDDSYYSQFTASIRAEAASMARHYERFYCLENSIRELVTAQLLAAKGDAWWDQTVSQAVKDNVLKNLQREQEAGITLRSDDLIDYTTFGELGETIQANWDVFADTFNNRKAVTRILTGLNLLRGPIAHCSPLASDEVTRLDLAIRDWFRLME